MSYHPPQQQAPRRKGGGGLFFLILFGVGSFLIFSRMGNGRPGEHGAGQPEQQIPQRPADPLEDDYASQQEVILAPDKSSSNVGQPMPSTGGTGAASGWEMEEVVTKKNVEFERTRAASSSSAKTQKGDWTIEEVDGHKDTGRQFKFSNPSNPPTSDSSREWSIQDIEKSPTKSKTQKGDWSIEEN